MSGIRLRNGSVDEYSGSSIAEKRANEVMTLIRRALLLGAVVLLSLTGCNQGENGELGADSASVEEGSAQITEQVPATDPPATSTPRPGSIIVSDIDGMSMAYVPAGAYVLGSDQSEIDWTLEQCMVFHDDCQPSSFEDEMPSHAVQLAAYWIDQTEVTVAMFARFVENTGYETEAERTQFSNVYDDEEWERERNVDWLHPTGSERTAPDDEPVRNVSWHDAWVYCQWAGKRLPTEAEWEAAARGSDHRLFPWSNLPPSDTLANLADGSLYDAAWRNSEIDDGFREVSPVDAFPAGSSPYGLMGMAGNVKEWVYDWYSPGYDLADGAANPVVSINTGQRVRKGGGYTSSLTAARSANRAGEEPYWTASDLGFRCVSSSIKLPEPPRSDSPPLPEMILAGSRTTLYEYTDGKFERMGSIESLEGSEITGQYLQCRYLRLSTPEYEEAWVRLDDDVVLHRPCEEIEPVLLSWVINIVQEGKNSLMAINEGDQDVLVTLIPLDNESESSKPYWMYIRAGEQITLERISDGSFEIYLDTGSDWDEAESKFQSDARREKLREVFRFTSTGTTTTDWKLTIDAAAGTVDSVRIDEADSP
jgi:formylglycine-generating enzyme required for sulfatase activity